MNRKVIVRDPVIIDDPSPVMSEIEEDIPFAQNILKDTDLQPTANTQAVKVAIPKEKQKSKRKTESKNTLSKKKMNVDELVKNASRLSEEETHMSLLSLLMLIWSTEFLLHVTTTIESEWSTIYMEQTMTLETSSWIANNYAENFFYFIKLYTHFFFI